MPRFVRPIVIASVLSFACAALAQQPAPLIQNVAGRKTTSLDGAWHTIVDQYDTGYYDYRRQPTRSGFFKNAKPRDKQDLVEYDFDKSPTLNVPGDWNSQSDRLFFYEGTIWYERDFQYHPQANHRVFLYVGAANYESHVAVNGTRICDHEGGFTPYNCEVTKLLRDGDNFVVIYVNNARRLDAVPTVNTDWWNYGGITREVTLVDEPETFVRDYYVQLAKGSRDRIAGWVQLDGVTGTQSVTVRIPELKVEKAVTTDANGRATIDIAVPGVQLWSPDSPKLYDVEIASGGDVVRDQVGFRTIETRGQDILLNGKPIFLRGVSIHEEAAGPARRAWSEADDRVLLGWVQELGGNYVRLAHYPHNEHMLRLADKLGILVWAEIPVYWTIDFTNQQTYAKAQQQLDELIARDHNRASVIIWSVGNETPISPPRTEFMSKLAATAHELDPTRLVSAALQPHGTGPNDREISDPLGQYLDVLGCNEYIGWYEGTADTADHTNWHVAYDKPLIMSEFGAGAVAGRHGATDERWTEEYQANVYTHQLQMLSRISNLRGMTPWILKDFRSPKRLLPDIQDYFNRKGLVSDKGEKKKAFFVLQDAYRKTKGSARLITTMSGGDEATPMKVQSPDREFMAELMPVVSPQGTVETRVTIRSDKIAKPLSSIDFSSGDGEHGYQVHTAMWSTDSHYFVLAMRSSGGHSPMFEPIVFWSRKTNEFYELTNYTAALKMTVKAPDIVNANTWPELNPASVSLHLIGNSEFTVIQ